MANAYILFNGIQYPFAVAEAAIGWARQSKGRLVALFIRAANATKEGYLFPSDLDAAETVNSAEDALSSHEAVIESNIRMLTNDANRHSVTLVIKTLIEPTDDEIAKELSDAEMVFACDDISRQKTLTADSVDWNRILNEHPAKVLHA